ncbi:MAG: NAD(P)/FAD-dependent oxidoreductase [Syntrophales bacterium]
MIQRIEISVDPDHIHDPDHIRRQIEKQAPRGFDSFRIVRRSIDARRSKPRFTLQVELDPEALAPEFHFAPIAAHPAVIIVGAGPAGLFAALELIEQGIKPIVLERGQKVEQRRKSIAQLLRRGELNPDSNYCFGEGGAGAFSDGKLYTRSNKRGDIYKLLHLLILHGASPDILIDAHPHIGSNKLPTLIRHIRQTIIACGGEIHFDATVSDLLIDGDAVKGVRLRDSAELCGHAVILAVGHSARDVYRKLYTSGIVIEAKPLAIGLRVEHPQALIDAIQYRRSPRHPNLPPATYQLTCQSQGRGVYSFCMCPGGIIVPTSTQEGELAINGMSFSGRRGPFANAGLVVELRPEDLEDFDSRTPFGFMALQQQLEQKAFLMGGGRGQQAPAQRMTDFMSGKISGTLPTTSYRQGLVSSPLQELFPPAVLNRLRQALTTFDRRLKGFLSAEALLVAIESRTSSPVRIPRNSDTLMHPQVRGLFPCGEGAGYAGGITSSAMDGQRAARQVACFLKGVY